MCSVITAQGDLIFGGVVSNRKFKLFGLEGSELPPLTPPSHPLLYRNKKFPYLVGHPDLLISKTLRRLLDLLAEMILKKSDCEYFTPCRVKDKKWWQIL